MIAPRSFGSQVADPVDGFARYVALLERQLTALDADDMATFGALSDERDALARELEAAGAPGVLEDAELVRPLLLHCVELDSRVRIKLQGMRDQTLAELRALDAQQSNVVRYLQTAPGGQRLNLRS